MIRTFIDGGARFRTPRLATSPGDRADRSEEGR